MRQKLTWLMVAVLAVFGLAGCEKSALVGRAGPAATGRKSVVCFTLKTDYTSLDRRPIAGPTALIVASEPDRTRTFVSLASRPGVEGAVEKSTPDSAVFTQLVLLELPAGEYSLEQILLPDTFRWTELDTPKKMIFTVKDSQVTYAGEAVLKLQSVQHEVMAEMFTWTLDHADTVARDRAWAEKSFRWVKTMPSGVVPFRSKPASPAVASAR